MRVKRAISIVTDNFPNAFKLLLYHLIIGLLFAGGAYVVLTLNLGFISESAEWISLRDTFLQSFQALFSGDLENFAALFGSLDETVVTFGNFLFEHISSIVGSGIGVVLLWLLYRILATFGSFTVGSLIDERMKSSLTLGFTSTYFALLRKSSLYAVCYVPLSLLYDVLCIALSYTVVFVLLSFMNALLSVMLMATAVVCFVALKFTLISGWLPAMLDGKGVGKALGASLSAKKHFGGRFSGFLVSVYLIMAVNVIAVIGTAGSALLLTIPLSYMLILALQLVNYYEDGGRRYFISENKIVEGGDLVK